MNDFAPFLQIIHISDLHITEPRSPLPVMIRNCSRKLRRVLPPLADAIDDGTSPHDPRAADLFSEFLGDLMNDREWAGCKTWLVDTGDLTSLGDSKSLNLGLSHLKHYIRVCPDFASTYGNHDAWPGTLPMLADKKTIGQRSQILSSAGYTVASPQRPLTTAIPHEAGSVHLFVVDSVIHDRWRNTRAVGELPDTQLTALTALVDQTFDPAKHDFRILAVHHPVHYPPPRPTFLMVMRNDARVGMVLDTPTAGTAYPVAHLVLSGHTHALYPVHGQLPAQPSSCVHPHLGLYQCQFVVGSLTQLDRYQRRGPWAHQCEVLRFYYSRSNPTVLVVERLLAARQPADDYMGAGLGPYKFVPVPGTRNRLGEEISFSV